MTQASTKVHKIDKSEFAAFARGWNAALRGENFYSVYPHSAGPGQQKLFEAGWLYYKEMEQVEDFLPAVTSKTGISNFIKALLPNGHSHFDPGITMAKRRASAKDTTQPQTQTY